MVSNMYKSSEIPLKVKLPNISATGSINKYGPDRNLYEHSDSQDSNRVIPLLLFGALLFIALRLGFRFRACIYVVAFTTTMSYLPWIVTGLRSHLTRTYEDMNFDSISSRFVTTLDHVRLNVEGLRQNLLSTYSTYHGSDLSVRGLVQDVTEPPIGYPDTMISPNRDLYQMLVSLTCVAITSFTVSMSLRCSYFKSLIFGIIMVGFVQFYMHKNQNVISTYQEKLDLCANLPLHARLFNLVGYDYYNCKNVEIELMNVARVGVEYISELIMHPIVAFATASGRASQSFLSAFSTINQMTLAPVYLLLLYLLVPLTLGFVIFLLIYMGQSNRNDRRFRKPSITRPSVTGRPNHFRIEDE